MTDRQIIRNEIARINAYTQSDILTGLIAFIDSMQEDPVAPKVLEDMLNAKTAAESLGISQEEHDRIVDELIYGKEPELVDVDDLPNKEEEPVSKVWHDSNKEQPNFASTVAIWNPKYKNGEIISRCTKVYSDRIWAYIDDLLKM